jgi:1,2-diacylglycerol 3-beta-glucosyltransferase
MIFYCIILAVAQALLKRDKFDELNFARGKDYKPFVNVIVPAHNEECVLAETIENFVQIDYPCFDILIMDDRSKDNTFEIAKTLAAKYKDKVKVYSRPNDSYPGKAAVLNDALAMTSGEVLCVFDADARVKPDFLNKILPYLLADKTAAVQARKIIVNKENNFLTRVQSYEYSMDANIQTGRDSLKGAVELRGNGQVIKRTALETIGGWTNNTLTDDLDISTKLQLAGYDIRFRKDVCVYEEAASEWKVIVNQRKRWAEGSIRRYLDYLREIIISSKITNRVGLDMLFYFSEFILPIWLISDFFIQLFSLFLGRSPQFFSNFIVILAISLFFITLLLSSIVKYDHYNFLKALKWALGTAAFVIVLWTIVVSIVVIKILFTKRELKWYKTIRVAGS